MRKVVVTGGAGFIGSHLAESLAMEGSEVVIIDNLSTGHMENINHIIDRKNVTFVNGSILDLPLLEKTFRDVEYVFHQAASISVPESMENPLKYNVNNTTGTLNVLLAAKQNQAKKVIFASSSAVYGEPKKLPMKEEDQLHPISPYAASKLASEYYCKVFNSYGLKTVCLRYFNVYGPRQDPASEYANAICSFINRISAGMSPIIYGDGEQSRDLVYVQDVVNANIILANNSDSIIYNVGTGTSTTINEIAELIIEIMARNIKPRYVDERLGDVKHTCSDISKLRALGFVPEWNIKQGLSNTIPETKTIT